MLINKLLIVFVCSCFMGCSARISSSESWVDYDHLAKLELGMNKNDIISILGDPILVLADSEYDNTFYVFYNYHIKKYQSNNTELDLNHRNKYFERSTLLKFTFVDDNLTAWEEDKMTLGMAKNNSPKTKGSMLQYFSLLLNMILLIKVF